MASIYRYKAGWRAQVRLAGKRSVSRVFAKRAEAARWAREAEREADAGAAVGGRRTPVGELIRAYRTARQEAGRPIARQSNTRYMLDRLEREFRSVRLEALGTPEIVAYARTRRAQGAGGYTVNMELSALGTALRYACSLLRVSYHDPVTAARPTLHHLGLISGSRHRERRPSKEEWERLVIALGALRTRVPILDIVRLNARNAFRRGEVLRIRWPDLDVERSTVIVRNRKHPRQTEGNDHEVPLIGDSLAIIMRQPRPRDGAKDQRIFPYSPGNVSRLFTAAVRRAGIVDLHFHDLRHESASALFERGWAIPEVAAVTGHRNWNHLKRYVQLDPARIARRGATGDAGSDQERS